MPPIRALIVDDHPVTREGLRTLLELSGDDAVVVVGEAGSGEEAVQQVVQLEPDVVFMDVRMPGISGIEATKQIRKAHPGTKVILITIDESRGAISEAIQAGVSGYLLKDSSEEAIAAAERHFAANPSVASVSRRLDGELEFALRGDADEAAGVLAGAVRAGVRLSSFAPAASTSRWIAARSAASVIADSSMTTRSPASNCQSLSSPTARPSPRRGGRSSRRPHPPTSGASKRSSRSASRTRSSRPWSSFSAGFRAPAA